MGLQTWMDREEKWGNFRLKESHDHMVREVTDRKWVDLPSKLVTLKCSNDRANLNIIYLHVLMEILRVESALI